MMMVELEMMMVEFEMMVGNKVAEYCRLSEELPLEILQVFTDTSVVRTNTMVACFPRSCFPTVVCILM